MTICPTCGRGTSPLQGSNGGDSLSLQVPLAALPALEYALAIGRNTQKMSSGPQAAEILESLRQEVHAAIPDCARIFRKGHWAAFCVRIAAGETMTASLIDREENRWCPDWRVMLHAVDTDPKTGYMSQEGFEDKAAAEKVLAAIPEEIARLTPMRG